MLNLSDFDECFYGTNEEPEVSTTWSQWKKHVRHSIMFTARSLLVLARAMTFDTANCLELKLGPGKNAHQPQSFSSRHGDQEAIVKRRQFLDGRAGLLGEDRRVSTIHTIFMLRMFLMGTSMVRCARSK